MIGLASPALVELLVVMGSLTHASARNNRLPPGPPQKSSGNIAYHGLFSYLLPFIEQKAI